MEQTSTWDHYADTFDNVLEGYQIISPEYRYLYVNNSVAKQGQSTKEALIGHTMMEKYPGIEQTPFFTELKRAMERREVRYFENEFTFPDGTKGWFELRIEPIPEGVFILSLDITERKEVQARERELNELRDTFITVISHQLRTPLNATRWNLEQLLGGESGPLSEGQREIVRTSHKGCVEVINRIHDFLTALDIEQHHSVPHKHYASVDKLLRSALIELEELRSLRNLSLKVNLPEEELPTLNIDSSYLHEAFLKLITNAFVYSKDQGNILVSLTKKEKALHFEITDEGIGVPEAEQAQLFTRFFRGSNASNYYPNASGLGLYMTKYFIETHGGSIGFHSTQGEGSTFWFELPTLEHPQPA